MDIPLDPSQPVEQQSYLIQFDDFSTISIPIADMSKYIPKPPKPLSPATKNDPFLPDFLQLKKRSSTSTTDNTIKAASVNVMVSIGLCINAMPTTRTKNGGPPSLILPTTGVASASKKILLRSHNVSTFLHNPKSSNFDPVANIVSG